MCAKRKSAAGKEGKDLSGGHRRLHAILYVFTLIHVKGLPQVCWRALGGDSRASAAGERDGCAQPRPPTPLPNTAGKTLDAIKKRRGRRRHIAAAQLPPRDAAIPPSPNPTERQHTNPFKRFPIPCFFSCSDGNELCPNGSVERSV